MTHNPSRVTPFPLKLILINRHSSHITHHTSHVTRHTSHLHSSCLQMSLRDAHHPRFSNVPTRVCSLCKRYTFSRFSLFARCANVTLFHAFHCCILKTSALTQHRALFPVSFDIVTIFLCFWSGGMCSSSGMCDIVTISLCFCDIVSISLCF